MTNDKKRVRIPKICIVFLLIALLSAIIYIAAIISEDFADIFNLYVSSVIRALLAYITNILPVSLAELLIIGTPILLFFLIRYSVKKYSDSWHDVGIFCISALSIISILFSVFVFSFGTGYHAPTLDKKLSLERKGSSAEELSETALWLIEHINAEIDRVDFSEGNSSSMPYSIREMNDILLSDYERLSAEYSFIPKLTSYVKPIILSKPMTYTHISGVYTYITGEANVNTNCPDYSMPYTAAHELAHQRGIAREDEANFVAFLVCMQSEDSYIRYCGYMNLCEYVLNAIYSADKELWTETYSVLDRRALREMNAYSDFYAPYRDNIIGDISGAINDAYLQANGTEGTRSYGLVVDLAVAYFHTRIEDAEQ